MKAELFGAEARRIEKLLYRVAWSYLGNGQDVEDAVQDALVKAWEKRDTLRDIGQFRPWMTRILTNRCKDMLRRRKRWSFYPLYEDTAQVEMPETENAVTAAMIKLKPELRIVMTLHYVDGRLFRQRDGGSPGDPRGDRQNPDAERAQTARQDAPH